ncbi:MAG TPA: hypothetical protein DCY79_04745 [Planctomycetaceae bacterium]|nr:hypothetical protein [Planctomycetaceae bacterium]
MNGLIATSLMVLAAGASDVEWMDNYGAALEAARAADRPLLVLLENSTAAVKAVETADADLLENYVVCRVDVSTEYGKRVAAAFKTSLFPYTAVIDKTGKRVLYRKSGDFTADGWKEMLAMFQDGEISTLRVVNYRLSGRSSNGTVIGPGGSKSSFRISKPKDCKT